MQHEAVALTTPMLITLGITVGGFMLFLWNRLRPDLVGLLVMAALMVTGILTPEEAVSGFANEATLTVAAMLVLSAGLLRTGAVDVLGRWIAAATGGSEWRLLVVMLATVIPVSALINNTAAVAILLPLVLGLSRDIGAAPSRLLMPLSFGSQLGGTLTLIGTSTNLLVAGLVLDLGVERIHLFDITPPAAVMTVVGVVYLLTIGRWLTPTREVEPDLLSSYELREYLTGLIVQPDSPLAGRSLADTRFGSEHGLQVIGIEREGERQPFPTGSTVIQGGDLLLVTGKIPDIAEIEVSDHLRIAGTTPNLGGDLRLVEVIVSPRSSAVGDTIRNLRLRNRYGLSVIAVQRRGEALRAAVGDVRLAAGDILLVQGESQAVHELHRTGDFSVLGAVVHQPRRRRKIRLAVGIMLLVVLLPALNITTILVSAILGTIAMLLTRCLTLEEAYDDIDWMVIVLLGSIIPLGIAMLNTGVAEWLAQGLLRLTAPLGVHGTLFAVYLLTSGLTAVLTNNAAAVVVTPLAVATATTLQVSPLPFVVAVMFAASNSFVTPIGYQTNTFIFGPGGYRFSDFARVGGPLNLILLATAVIVIPFFFPFDVR